MKASNEYTAQALALLAAYGITCDIHRADPHGPGHAPQWAEGEEHGNQYKITLSGEGRNPVTFDFWGSINDRKKGEDPTEYDILACVSGDINCPDTFEDFCSEYGYDEDSRKAYATWDRCRNFAEKLQGFFCEGEERDSLAEIQ
jgi:hypothetical protein